MSQITAATVSMSSREIAELTDKEHKNVKRDIEKTLSELGEDKLKFERIYFDSMNRPQTEYFLNREMTEVLLMGYSAPLRLKVIRRLRELEERASNSTIALNDPAQLRALLLDNVEKVIALEAKVEADAPKTKFFDSYLNADGLYGIQNAARALGCRPNKFSEWLRSKFVFYQGGNLTARAAYIGMGIFTTKTTIVDDKVRTQAFITPKGLKYLDERVPAEIRLGALFDEARK